MRAMRGNCARTVSLTVTGSAESVRDSKEGTGPCAELLTRGDGNTTGWSNQRCDYKATQTANARRSELGAGSKRSSAICAVLASGRK